MVKINYYQILDEKFQVLDHVKSFIRDFTVHNKAILSNYKGDFILAIRKTGTNLVLLARKQYENDFLQDEGKKRLKKYYEIWIKTYNNRFFHGINGKIKEIKDLKELDKILEKYNDGYFYN
ncbi:MAG: hypothetical protein ACTSVV_11260 [Promethearchaeota archaeon]